ncbi:group II truncated hemoglobin [Hyphomicrobium sp.]|uniref:group II truncated hemoglobin n=1 Tax=Hyphomicrobium sp. TaxID=82 RepID=UPI003F6F795B
MHFTDRTDAGLTRTFAAVGGAVGLGITSDGSLYELIGADKGLRALIETFYDIVEFEPEGELLLTLHRRGHGVAHSRIEQFDFLSGFLGGPRLYVEHHGHSDVRAMHEHVDVSEEARDAWLKCMAIAIDRVGLPNDLKQRLMMPFTHVAKLLQDANAANVAIRQPPDRIA